jgi:23S rRNA pseudouridine1911/1915/1917 synthase
MNSIEILFEDSALLVINKPAGIMVHSDGRSEEPTVVDWVKERYPEIENVGEPIELKSGRIIVRPGIVHRIDKDTSGALVVAKTPEAFLHLKKQFKSREVGKEYQAFLYGVLNSERGTIDRPIGRSKSDFRKRSAQRGARGDLREAITTYRVIERGDGFTFVEARPLTGRTHQIRVHFKAINYPIIADSLYAAGKPNLLGFERLALHARSIEFKDLTGKLRRIEAPYPADFENAINLMKNGQTIATE